jgi:hypothetical protein
VTRLSYGWQPALTVNYTGSAIRAEVGVSDSYLKISTLATGGTTTTTKLQFADYPTVTLLAAAVAAVSGWTASVTVNTASADLNPLGGRDAKAHPVILSYPDRADIDYTVDYTNGLVELNSFPWGGGGCSPLLGRVTGYESEAVFPGGHQYILAQYRAGYETIPDDVNRKCCEMVADAYNDTFVARKITAATLGPFMWKAAPQQVDVDPRRPRRLRRRQPVRGGRVAWRDRSSAPCWTAP